MTNPPEFEAAVAAYLRGAEGQFNYDALQHTFLDVDRFRRWTRLVAGIRPVAGAAVLSSGCGMGGSLVAYHEAGAAEVVGVEVDAEFVHLTRLRVAPIATARVIEAAPDGRLPFERGRFDIIESMDVIEHVDDPLRYLRDLRRVLAPDGLILLVTPNRLWPVEQHLGVAGPPWLPVGLADRLFEFAARLPNIPENRAFRYRRLRGMRTQNMSLRTLRRLARDLDLHLSLIHHDPHDPEFPFPAEHPRAAAMLRSRVGKFLAPVRTLAVTLRPHR